MKITVKDASKIMGISPTLLRLMIRENKLPSNVAICVKNKNRHYYYINKEAFIKFLDSSN